jgi:signal peptidase II
LVVAADQLSKRWALRRLAGAEPIRLAPWLSLMCVRNRRAMRGLAPGTRPWILLWCCALVASLALTLEAPSGHALDAALALGIALGGAFGNLVDRYRRGAVTDFIAVGFWPVFNLADVAIASGVLLSLWALSPGGPQ